MKKVTYAFLTAVIALFAITSFAADKNIAFVDGGLIIQKYQPQIDAKLQEEFKAREDKLVELQKKLVGYSERYNRDAAIMSQEEVQKLEKEFGDEQQQFQKLSNEFNQKRQKRANEELERLLDNVKDVSGTIAKKQGYDIVLQRGAAIFIENEKADITEAVMKQLTYK